MFSVLFEAHPRPEQWSAYLSYAKMLRPELEQIDGFLDNIRYGSLTRKGWLLSLSSWRDEKSLVRWRTRASHHDVQEKGRSRVLLDYHLRVGQITHDTHVPAGHALVEQRLDRTEVGEGTTALLVTATRPPEPTEPATAAAPLALAAWLGLNPDALGLASWDVYDAVLSPGDLILMTTWRDEAAAAAFADAMKLPPTARARRIRIVRDYAMFDRREAPQYYPDAPRET